MLSKLKEIGLKYSLAIVFNRLVPESLFRFRRFDVFQLPPVRQDVSTSPGQAVIAYATSESDLAAAQQLTSFQQNIAIGDQQAAVIQNGVNTVAAIWISEERFLEQELGLVINLSPEQRWLFSAYVDKQQRRQGLYRKLLNFVTNQDSVAASANRAPSSINTTAPANATTFLLAINPDNRRSMSAHVNLGAKRIARVSAWRLLKFARVKAKSKAADWQVALEEKQSSDCRNNPTCIRFAQKPQK